MALQKCGTKSTNTTSKLVFTTALWTILDFFSELFQIFVTAISNKKVLQNNEESVSSCSVFYTSASSSK